jgi:hypothetical protein
VAYKNKDPSELVASVALLLVRPGYRNHGIGLRLYEEALGFLKGIRGISRVQLGSTIPRILYGIPSDLTRIGVDWMDPYDWFEQLGWVVNGDKPGQGQEVCDWFLKFDDLPMQKLDPSSLVFRFCRTEDTDTVLGFVDRISTQQERTGWFDQYAVVACGGSISTTILLGQEDDRLVSTALLFTPNDGSPPAKDIPWPAKLGRRVGGVTCICIEGKHFSLAEAGWF